LAWHGASGNMPGSTPRRCAGSKLFTSPSPSMPAVRPCPVPQDSLLHAYQRGTGFADCYVAGVAGAVSQAAFVEAFYTSGLFKVERTLLQHLASRPATDAEARLLAQGQARRFSAWQVEGQSDGELLLADLSGRTCSWLRASAIESPTQTPRTRLYFGSAVVPRQHGGAAQPGMGWPFHALLGFHRLYSRLLLQAASWRVRAA
jgi:hypothetical protein